LLLHVRIYNAQAHTSAYKIFSGKLQDRRPLRKAWRAHEGDTKSSLTEMV